MFMVREIFGYYPGVRDRDSGLSFDRGGSLSASDVGEVFGGGIVETVATKFWVVSVVAFLCRFRIFTLAWGLWGVISVVGGLGRGSWSHGVLRVLDRIFLFGSSWGRFFFSAFS